MRVEVVKVPKDDAWSAQDYQDYPSFVALCDGERCGRIDLMRERVGALEVLAVDSVKVSEHLRRRGIATKLYEAAARLACDRRVPLASIARTKGAHSNAFWAKQLAKGRAVRLAPPSGRNWEVYVLKACAGFDLSGVRRRTKRKQPLRAR